jgi:hypothetical protein
MGMSKNGSCSGLHHDFHDNLYILVHGVKEFLLFSPGFGIIDDIYVCVVGNNIVVSGEVEKMYLNGVVEKVHANGLINYVEHVSRQCCV